MRLFHLKVDFFQNITNKEDKGEVHSMLKKTAAGLFILLPLRYALLCYGTVGTINTEMGNGDFLQVMTLFTFC